MTQHSLVDQSVLIIEDSRSHSDTPHSLGVLLTSDRPDAETTHNTHNGHPWPPPRWNSNTQSQQASGVRLTP